MAGGFLFRSTPLGEQCAALCSHLVGGAPALGEGRPAVVFAASAPPSRNRDSTGACRKELPEFSLEEIERHASRKKSSGSGGRVWVTYKCGVYDVTEFIEQHPGGIKRILLAAGGDIERFWKQFTIHDDDAVRDILETHRIGNIKDYKAASNTGSRPDDDADRVWASEPKRSPALGLLNQRPFNAETPEGVLDEFFTPNDMFFVRNHMPVPDIKDVDARHSPFCLKVEGEGLVPRCFRVAELKELFPQHTIVNTIQCGGNRRSEMAAAYSTANGGGAAVKGLNWGNGGIGTASWTGVWLRDVIQSCRDMQGATTSAATLKAAGSHVLFEGADADAAGPFNVSIPLNMAMDPNQDCLIAYEMNGEPIPRDHGYPLRAVIPGTVGVRNCKWLKRVAVQPSESQSVWQQQDYKNFPPYATKPDPSLPSVYAMPVQSSITDAAHDANSDTVSLAGYAYAGGGNGIQRVDVSFDNGATFEANVPLLPVASGALPKATPATTRDAWAWRHFKGQFPVESIRAKPQQCRDAVASDVGVAPSCYRVCTKALADDQATQPPTAPYNFRGLLYNGYSCRDVRLND